MLLLDKIKLRLLLRLILKLQPILKRLLKQIPQLQVLDLRLMRMLRFIYLLLYLVVEQQMLQYLQQQIHYLHH